MGVGTLEEVPWFFLPFIHSLSICYSFYRLSCCTLPFSSVLLLILKDVGDRWLMTRTRLCLHQWDLSTMSPFCLLSTKTKLNLVVRFLLIIKYSFLFSAGRFLSFLVGSSYCGNTRRWYRPNDKCNESRKKLPLNLMLVCVISCCFFQFPFLVYLHPYIIWGK